MKRIAPKLALVLCFVFVPTSVPIRTTFAAAAPQFVWCRSASLNPDVHQFYYSNIFRGNPANGAKIADAYWKYLVDAYPDRNAGPSECNFYTSQDGAGSEKKKAKAQNRFDNWDSIETGWSYSH
jgi:hypothetical protein